jgi:hypothetical protein
MINISVDVIAVMVAIRKKVISTEEAGFDFIAFISFEIVSK